MQSRAAGPLSARMHARPQLLRGAGQRSWGRSRDAGQAGSRTGALALVGAFPLRRERPGGLGCSSRVESFCVCLVRHGRGQGLLEGGPQPGAPAPPHTVTGRLPVWSRETQARLTVGSPGSPWGRRRTHWLQSSAQRVPIPPAPCPGESRQPHWGREPWGLLRAPGTGGAFQKPARPQRPGRRSEQEEQAGTGTGEPLGGAEAARLRSDGSDLGPLAVCAAQATGPAAGPKPAPKCHLRKESELSAAAAAGMAAPTPGRRHSTAGRVSWGV